MASPLAIEDQNVRKLVSLLREVKGRLEGTEDIRLALAKLERIKNIAEGMVDASDNADTRFALFLIRALLGLATVYERRTDKWYELNAQNVSNVRHALATYLGRTAEALEARSYSGVIDASKDWFFVLHDLGRDQTADTSTTT